MISTQRIRWSVWPWLTLAAMVLAPFPAAGDESVRASVDGATVSVSVGGRVALEYRYRDVPAKPYVSKLATPGGVQVLLDAPADHLHHHALMLAVAVDGVDFWAEGEGRGRQEHRELTGAEAKSMDGAAEATFAQRLAWMKPGDERPLLVEKRTIRLLRPAGADHALVTWQSELSVAEGREKVALGGSHYFGLGLRMIEAMNAVGKFINAAGEEGEVVRGDERLTAAAWCACVAPVEGKPVTVAMLDHPGNPRHPARMFTMAKPFAYLSATMNLWKEPMELKAGEPLVLRYGVVVADGELSAERIEAIHKAWAAARGTE